MLFSYLIFISIGALMEWDNKTLFLPFSFVLQRKFWAEEFPILLFKDKSLWSKVLEVGMFLIILYRLTIPWFFASETQNTSKLLPIYCLDMLLVHAKFAISISLLYTLVMWAMQNISSCLTFLCLLLIILLFISGSSYFCWWSLKLIIFSSL